MKNSNNIHIMDFKINKMGGKWEREEKKVKIIFYEKCF